MVVGMEDEDDEEGHDPNVVYDILSKTLTRYPITPNLQNQCSLRNSYLKVLNLEEQDAPDPVPKYFWRVICKSKTLEWLYTPFFMKNDQFVCQYVPTLNNSLTTLVLGVVAHVYLNSFQRNLYLREIGLQEIRQGDYTLTTMTPRLQDYCSRTLFLQKLLRPLPTTVKHENTQQNQPFDHELRMTHQEFNHRKLDFLYESFVMSTKSQQENFKRSQEQEEQLPNCFHALQATNAEDDLLDNLMLPHVVDCLVKRSAVSSHPMIYQVRCRFWSNIKNIPGTSA
jgi:hypothetical protein